MRKLSLYLLAVLFMGCANAQEKPGDHDFVSVPSPRAGEAVATWGGGCFWAMGEAMSELKGVNKVIAGYAGGNTKNPTYDEVCTRTTNHAETVQVYYNPKVISYANLVKAFFSAHNPTTLNEQGPDKGTDYRSTYPVFDADNLPKVNLKNQPVPSKDAPVNNSQLDSFMRVANQQVVDKSKKIKITGSAAFADPFVSVYNQQGIKVVSQFDNRIAYTYELMIPFKYLGISLNQTKFYYNIKFNGSVRAEGSFIENIPGGVRVNGPGTMADMQFISSATDLSNEYIIAKK